MDFVLVVEATRLTSARTLDGAKPDRAAPRSAGLFALCVSLLSQPVIGSAQQPSYVGTNVTGAMSLSQVVNLRAQSQVFGFQMLAAAASEVVRPVPPRLVPPGVAFPSTSPKTSARVASPLAPAVSSSGVSANPLVFAPASGVVGFNALSHLDQRLANHGNQYSIEPPSPGLAVANGYILEGVNDAVQVYNLTGAPYLPIVLASNQVFGLPPAVNRTTGVLGVYLTDMRVYYDLDISRWFIVQRAQDVGTYGQNLTSSHLYMAVSQTADPAGSYNIYVMDTTNAGHPGCPCIADFPQIGSDQYGIHISWNEFRYDPSFGYYWFVDASILTLSKAALASGAALPTAVQFLLPYSSGFEFSLQPASAPPGASNFLASGGMEFFVSTYQGTANQVALWGMSNTSSLTTSNPGLVLIRTLVATLPYSLPGTATQRFGPTPYGSSLSPPAPLETLDGGDTRVLALSYASGRLYLTFQSGFVDQNSQRVVAAVFAVLSPTYRSGVLAGQALNQGYLFVTGNHLLRPAIAVNAKGAGAIGVTVTGNDWYPSAAVIPFQSFSVPSAIQVVAPGAFPEDGFTGYPSGGGAGVARWGDYNAAVAASDGSIWMVVQYIGPYARSDYANWNTYIFKK